MLIKWILLTILKAVYIQYNKLLETIKVFNFIIKIIKVR